MDRTTDTRFYATVSKEVWIDEDTLASDSNIQEIRESDLPAEEKVKKAREVARQIVMNALADINNPDDSPIFINHVFIDEVELDLRMDRVNWWKLVSMFEIPKEIDFRGHKGEPLTFTRDTEVFKTIYDLSSEEYEDYIFQLNKSGVVMDYDCDTDSYIVKVKSDAGKMLTAA